MVTAQRYHRKIIKVRAADSPNVRRALEQVAAGQEPDGKDEIPGILSWEKYEKRLKTWDKIRQCVGLQADFYEGAELLLFPPEWLTRCERLAGERPMVRSVRKSLGIDSAEGGDNSAFMVADKQRLCTARSLKTSDTTTIVKTAIELMNVWHIDPTDVIFDLGGGGKQHMDRMRDMGMPCRGVRFGASPSIELKRGQVMFKERKEQQEETYVYANMRAELYGEFSLELDPDYSPEGFAVDEELFNRKREDGGASLREQLAPLPRKYSNVKEGCLVLPPKRRRRHGQSLGPQEEPCLEDIIGCSPDESDALVLACWGLRNPALRRTVGAGG